MADAERQACALFIEIAQERDELRDVGFEIVVFERAAEF